MKEAFKTVAIMELIFMIIMAIINQKELTRKDAIIEEQGNKIIQQEAEIEKSSKCGVYPFEKGYIIDGYYYEYKGAADIKMEGE